MRKMRNNILVKQRARKLSPRREYNAIQREVLAYEKRLYSNLIKTFGVIYREIAKDYEATGRYPQTDNIYNHIFKTLEPFYRQIIESSSNRILTRRVLSKDEGLYSELTKDYIAVHGAINIKEISDTTRKIIRLAISNGITNGEGSREIAKNIRLLSSSGLTRYRAATIARTELHTAQNYGQIETAKKLNIPNLKKQWLSALDDRTREWHKRMNGVQVGLDERFIVPYKGINYEMDRPGDPRGGAANVINCRCTLLFIDPEDEM